MGSSLHAHEQKMGHPPQQMGEQQQSGVRAGEAGVNRNGQNMQGGGQSATGMPGNGTGWQLGNHAMQAGGVISGHQGVGQAMQQNSYGGYMGLGMQVAQQGMMSQEQQFGGVGTSQQVAVHGNGYMQSPPVAPMQDSAVGEMARPVYYGPMGPNAAPTGHTTQHSMAPGQPMTGGGNTPEKHGMSDKSPIRHVSTPISPMAITSPAPMACYGSGKRLTQNGDTSTQVRL